LPAYKKLAQDCQGSIVCRSEPTPTEQRQPKSPKVQVTADTIKIDRFKDHPTAWRQDEGIEEFLRRMPVDDPATAVKGPWLWVSSPTIPRSHATSKIPEDIDAFSEVAHGLLNAFKLERGKVEGDNPGKAAATVTKKMSPFRDQLEIDLLLRAIDTGTTCGKWMLFPKPGELKRAWAIVATATSQGKLGPVSKVGIQKPGDESTLICVYTYDFSDFEDVRRVLNQLVELNLCYADGKPIFYKCDAYTYLGIKSDNVYKLRASLYSSADILHDDRKALENGPVARLEKKRDEEATSIAQQLAGRVDG
jgi:hypothetical protein